LKRRKALVLGAQGLIGRSIGAHLVENGWDVLGVSRRASAEDIVFPQASVDLGDAQAVRAALEPHSDITHVLYAAYQERGNPAELAALNAAMLANTLDAVGAATSGLQHVTLYGGGKAYGSHLGPYKTPAKESDPRVMPPVFYYDQQDLLAERSAAGGFGYTVLRPDAMIGIAFGNPMNLLAGVAVYATISKELGLPLRFPGTSGNWSAMQQVTDADLLAAATSWAIDTPAANGQAFNVVNGDGFRWQHLWPVIADAFDMEVGPAQPMSLSEQMADKGPLWRSIVARYGLRDVPYKTLVSWPFCDGMFSVGYDLIQSTVKIRKAGFHDTEDTESTFCKWLERLRSQGYIPPR
jgi:nucleoside-diphosphate-sugar epimerase